VERRIAFDERKRRPGGSTGGQGKREKTVSLAASLKGGTRVPRGRLYRSGISRKDTEEEVGGGFRKG